MGSWSVSCGISNIAITAGNDCVILPLRKSIGLSYQSHQPVCLPIFGTYNDYGGMENIIYDDNTRLIEKHFGVSIEDFVEFLVDGKFYYNRSGAKEIGEKINDVDGIYEMKFMWINRKVYDYMVVGDKLDSYDSLESDYGYIMGGSRWHSSSSGAKKIYNKYFKDLSKFGDRYYELCNLYFNLLSMSGEFRPHVLYLTPQCGDYKKHQELLDKFSEINRSYFK